MTDKLDRLTDFIGPLETDGPFWLPVRTIYSSILVKNILKMATPRAESEDQLKLRFQVELEFVQCLANPNYLNFLAQREYFKDQSFINYLKYLLYWKEPEYARFLKYPMSLYFLDLLQYPEFRKELANNKCSKFIEDQQLLHWQHYIRKRSKLVSSSSNANSNNSNNANANNNPSGGTSTVAAGNGDTNPTGSNSSHHGTSNSNSNNPNSNSK